MPYFPIIDTHLHVWDPTAMPYDWVDGDPFLNRPFGLDDYNQATDYVEVEKMVFLQCEVNPSHYEQEAAWVTQLAAQDPRIQGIVPWAPIEKGQAVRADVERLIQNNPLVKGVRRIIQFEDDINFCLDPNFIDGVRTLAGLNMSFDICLIHYQLENAVEMVRQCPDVSFILDHIGKPAIKDKQIEPWLTNLRNLAALPNTVCKVSGMTTEADWDNWTKEDLKPYFDHVVETFTPDRIIYGGDWPVSAQATKYTRWVETVDWATDQLSPTEKRKLFRDNAIAFYRL